MPTLDELLNESKTSSESVGVTLDSLLNSPEPIKNQRPEEDKLNLDEMLLVSQTLDLWQHAQPNLAR